MGISSAISNALSGLGAVSRSTEIVSRNVANAKTSGYSRLEVQTAQNMLGREGAGVAVKGVTRAGDPFLTAARMRSEADSAKADGEAQAYRKLADFVIDPKGGDSLQNRFSELENGLRALADTPESSAIRATAAEAAGAVARRLNAISTQARQLRIDADADIQRQVQTVNTALKRIEGLNGEIEQAKSSGRDSSALEDERQRQLDIVNRHVPIKTSNTGRGALMVTTRSGGVLLEGKAFQLTFEPSPAGANGYADLNGIGLVDSQGREIIPAPAADPDALPFYFKGGEIEASFTARDTVALKTLRETDKLAGDLIDRMQNLPDFDDGSSAGPPVVPADKMGLFVDVDAVGQDVRYDPANEQGVAERIRVNRLIDPRAGGSADLLEQGFTPATPSGLQSTPASEPFPAALYAAFKPKAATATEPAFSGFTMLSAEYQARRETDAAGPEADAVYKKAAFSTMQEEELSQSAVDTDAEMQQLMELERSYAANARVIQVADSMIRTLLESV